MLYRVQSYVYIRCAAGLLIFLPSDRKASVIAYIYIHNTGVYSLTGSRDNTLSACVVVL